MSFRMNRRRFLATGAAGVIGAGVALRPASASARVLGANDRVRIGVIGTGRQGLGVMRSHMALPEVEIAAVCDVYAPNLDKAASAAPQAGRVTDFRRIIDDTTIDAVIIATPDHWHALQTVMACQAGKDVYVEKPTSLTVVEGRKMVEAARKYNRIVQVGLQQRAAAHFQQAVQLIQEGRIGTVSMVRCWNVGNQAPDGFGNPPDGAPPPGLDWDMWLGPAPKRPFNANRFGVYPDAWSYFRYFWDYAGGMMTDWGVHLIDIAQWAMKADAPQLATAVGGTFAVRDNRETPDTILATFRYPTFTLVYENRSGNGRPINGKGYGMEFYGSLGTMFVDRAGFEIVPERRGAGEAQKALTEPLAVKSTPDNPTHARNFVDCMKSRQAPICDIEVGHRSSSTAMLGNLSFRTGAEVKWDGRTERIDGNRRASDLLDVPYRKPWRLKV
jgi:predicted dehydrogenase